MGGGGGGSRAKTLPSVPPTNTCIRHFRNENGTGAEMHPAIVSGIVTEDALVSYWSIFSVVSSNSSRSLCERSTRPSFPLVFEVTNDGIRKLKQRSFERHTSTRSEA